MRFDTIIGNPPYNNDIYLDFLCLGYNTATYYTCMITPSKWRIKQDSKSIEFRNTIVPYISDVVYYPNTYEVFDIMLHGGVAYTLINNQTPVERHLITKCALQELFATDGTETVGIKDLGILYNKTIRGIVYKLGTYDNLGIMSGNKDGKYNVAITNIYAESSCVNKSGVANVLTPPYLTSAIDKKNDHTSFLGSFDTELEAKSYISYLNTKFIRFMFLIAKSSLQITNSSSWLYVPKPDKFDHIFTDIELYEKYGLEDKEIDIIEKIIKKCKYGEVLQNKWGYDD